MKRIAIVFLTLFIALTTILSNAQSKSSYKIIIGKNNKTADINKYKLSRLFLKKIRKWDDGTRIYPVDLIEDEETRELFSKDVHDKKVSAIKAYWQKQIFTGRGVPPPEKRSDREILEYVQDHEGAIGYISISTSIENFDVRVLNIRENK